MFLCVLFAFSCGFFYFLFFIFSVLSPFCLKSPYCFDSVVSICFYLSVVSVWILSLLYRLFYYLLFYMSGHLFIYLFMFNLRGFSLSLFVQRPLLVLCLILRILLFLSVCFCTLCSAFVVSVTSQSQKISGKY